MIEFENKTEESPQARKAAMEESIAEVRALLEADKISPDDLYMAFVGAEIAGANFWESRQTAPTAVALFQELSGLAGECTTKVMINGDPKTAEKFTKISEGYQTSLRHLTGRAIPIDAFPNS